MINYLNLLAKIINEGDDRMDRTGTGTRALFTEMLEWDLRVGFPIVTTKKIPFDLIKAELLWFISGSSDVRELQKLGCKIWDANATDPNWIKRRANQARGRVVNEHSLGRVYGVQWRSWRTVREYDSGVVMDYNGLVAHLDQLADLIKRIKDNPYDRRLIVTAWNPGELEQMALPPCHMFFQCFCVGEYLDLTMYQRSCDTFLGVPFNISSYALMLSLLAQVTGRVPRMLKIIFGDVHIYGDGSCAAGKKDHFPMCMEQLKREPKPLPKLRLNPEIKDIDSFTMDDISLVGYEHHPLIKGEMSV